MGSIKYYKGSIRLLQGYSKRILYTIGVYFLLVVPSTSRTLHTKLVKPGREPTGWGALASRFAVGGGGVIGLLITAWGSRFMV